MSHAINAIRKISAKRQLVDGVNNNLFDVIKYRGYLPGTLFDRYLRYKVI